MRFLVLAVALAVLLLGLGTLVVDALDGGRFGPRLEGRFVLGGWLLQAVALVALYLLVQGRGGGWWLDGLLTAGIAWIFRGPVLVLTVAERLGPGHQPWWELTLHWLPIYAVVGLAIAWLARRLRLVR